jgi:4-hydroxyphenylpyruvate dioxygenase-like putative hemolysin
MRTDLTRREVLATLTAAVATSRIAFAAETPFHCGGIDHLALALAVDDIEKSVHFYARVFGATVLK